MIKIAKQKYTIIFLAYSYPTKSSMLISKIFASLFEFIIPTLSIWALLSLGLFLLSRDIIKKKTCKKCKESLDDADYDYALVSQEIKKNGNEYAKVIIEAECPHCGTIKTIKKGFITYNAQKGTAHDLQTNVDKYCMQLFNH